MKNLSSIFILVLMFPMFAHAKNTGLSIEILSPPSGGHSVSLSCTDTSTGVTFNFYRGVTAGGESATPLNSSPVSTCAYTDTTVVGLVTYFYTAKAACTTCVNGGPGLSAASNEVTTSIPSDPQPAPPVLTLGTVAKNDVPLMWKPPAKQNGYDIVAWEVLKGSNPTLPGPSLVALLPAWTVSYTDKVCTTTCYYAVKTYAIRSDKSLALSSMSDIVEAKIK